MRSGPGWLPRTNQLAKGGPDQPLSNAVDIFSAFVENNHGLSSQEGTFLN